MALFDPAHVHHEAAHEWFAKNRRAGWATCPLTENGVVRIVSNPAYPGRRTTLEDGIDRLRRFRASGDHIFWTDSISVSDASLFQPRHVRGHGQLTDVYLLALAVKHGGRLATFDRSIPLSSVAGSRTHHLALVGP